MKTLLCKIQLIRAVILIVLACSASSSFAQNTNPVNMFDIASSTTSFVVWWGPPNPTITWDSTRDAANDPNSGSVRYEEAFTGTANEQFMTHFTIANRWGWDGGYILDATSYTNLSFDIKIDPTSGQRRANNDYGNLEVGLTTDGWGTTYLPAFTIPLSATNWTHVDLALSPTTPNINKVVGFFVKMWSNGAHTNTLAFNLDNVGITKPEVAVVIPPPTLGIEKATSGLHLITTTASGQYGRQNIRTIGQGYSWVGATGPVSYSIDIKDAPGSTAGGFQTHMFLVPAADAPYGSGDSAVDWNATNVLWLNIQNAGARLSYKTNLGSGNSMYYNTNPVSGPVGVLANLPSPSPIGTWTLTFENNTNITLTSPSGGSTNVTLSPDAAALFAGPLFAQFGAQPNDVPNIGLKSIISRISTTNTLDTLDDSFAGPALDTAQWGLAAADAAGIQVVPASTAFMLNWTVPDSGFYAQWSSTLGSTWTDIGLTPALVNAKKWVQIPDSLSSSAAFFRLVKRTFSKLQILLPGETAAPGTATGKTGTPTPQQVGVPFEIIVNAVSDDWSHMTGIPNQQINLSSTDPAFSWPGFPGTMVNGQIVFDVATWNLSLNTTGAQTITATDSTDGAITPNTSAAVTVNP